MADSDSRRDVAESGISGQSNAPFARLSRRLSVDGTCLSGRGWEGRERDVYRNHNPSPS